MALSSLQLNRATLERQLLLRRERLPVADAVRRLVAVQAQEPASPYIALWNRLTEFDAADLDAAFAEGSVVKASLLRITLHAVHADDYPVFHEAMAGTLRASRVFDGRYTGDGLTPSDTDEVLPDLLAFLSRPRSKIELETMLEAHLGERAQRAWWALKTFAPIHHAPTGGPWSFARRGSYVAAPARERPSEAEAVQHLAQRYLEGFGPASVQDLAQFTLLRRSVIRNALAALGDAIVELDGPDRTTLFDVAGWAIPDEDIEAPPRLLPMWDSVLLAYSDRSRMIPPEYRRLVIHQNGDVLPTLLVDGHVAGVWRPVEGGIEATAFHRLSKGAWAVLESEAEGLVAFLGARDPAVYRRYGHWWSKLPSAEVRVLPG
jgi:hypothetical protein